MFALGRTIGAQFNFGSHNVDESKSAVLISFRTFVARVSIMETRGARKERRRRKKKSGASWRRSFFRKDIHRPVVVERCKCHSTTLLKSGSNKNFFFREGSCRLQNDFLLVLLSDLFIFSSSRSGDKLPLGLEDDEPFVKDADEVDYKGYYKPSEGKKKWKNRKRYRLDHVDGARLLQTRRIGG